MSRNHITYLQATFAWPVLLPMEKSPFFLIPVLFFVGALFRLSLVVVLLCLVMSFGCLVVSCFVVVFVVSCCALLCLVLFCLVVVLSCLALSCL